MKDSLSFIESCHNLYKLGYTPSNLDFRDDPLFHRFLNIAKKEVNDLGIESFYNYTQEYSYFVNLWTAHLIFEFFESSDVVKSNCLDIIMRYSRSKLNTKVASEEINWLRINNFKV
jgi:hypothetical protein